jgi:ribosomal protein S12 methylthiotransferase accessory factor
VAAARAITEAAQSRLTLIHGAREDLHPVSEQLRKSSSHLFALFDQLKPRTRWDSCRDAAGPDLLQDYEWILEQLAAAGYLEILRTELTPPGSDISVVRVFVPGLQCRGELF